MKIMRHYKKPRLRWGANMARGRENARLARALESAEEQDGYVGQFLVIGFGGPIRLVEFRARKRTMRAVDTGTGNEEKVSAKMVWRMARLAAMR